jgi:hypothetical protein
MSTADWTVSGQPSAGLGDPPIFASPPIGGELILTE